MEPNYNINRPKVSDDEINTRKNFDDLVKQFKAQSIQKARNDRHFLTNKTITYTAVIAGIAVLCTLTYYSVFKKQSTKPIKNDKTITTQVTTKNSTKKLTIPYTSYKVNANKGGEIKHQGKTKITIPKQAFVNKRGEDIIGDVEIKYREFHTPTDFVTSGIPMRYDSAGKIYHFESAGMFDIQGFQDGVPVYIKQNKTVEVALGSQQEGNQFNQYHLDTLTKQWRYLKKDNEHVTNGANNKEIETLKKKIEQNYTPQLAAIEKLEEQKNIIIPKKIDSVKTITTKKIHALPKNVPPAKPTKSTDRPKFELDIDLKEFPELASFKNAVMEIGTENKHYSPELANVTWSDAKISEGPDKGKNYLLTLRLGSRVEKLIVYPTLEGTNYDNALKVYEKKFEDYKIASAKREADELKLKQEYEAKRKLYLEEQEKITKQIIAERIRVQKEIEKELNQQLQSLNKSAQVIRIFSINGFGIYNSDCPKSLPQGKKVIPSFIVDNTQQHTPSTVYMISYTRNALYTLLTNELTSLPYNTDEEYALCFIEDNTFYICPKETFKSAVKTGTSKVNFSFTKLPESVENATDLKIALGI